MSGVTQMLKTIFLGAAQTLRAILNCQKLYKCMEYHNCQTLYKYTTNRSYIILQLSRGMQTLRAISDFQDYKTSNVGFIVIKINMTHISDRKCIFGRSICVSESMAFCICNLNSLHISKLSTLQLKIDFTASQ
jgi:hypothetical protein